MSETTSIVVVGGGVAAASFVRAYREAGGQDLITMLSAEKEPPYNRPPLSKGVLREEMEPGDALVQEAQAYEDQVIDLRLETPVTAIDVEAREVVTDEERIPYGTLVVATGARPRPFPVEGADHLFGVQTFRTMADAIDVRDARDAHSVLVAGASFIGVEVAASLRALGRNVTLIDPMGTVMPKLMCEELSTQLETMLEAKGIDLVLGDEIAELRANGRLLIGATTGEGRSIEAFLAIAGVGVIPNVELLADAGAETDDGVVVDERFRTSLPDVYAIGDVAMFPEPISGERKRVEHWSTATAHGSYLGRFLAAGADDGFEPYDEVPVFFTQVFDLKIQMLGAPREVDECTLVGSVDEGKLFGVHLKDGVPVGGLLAGHNQDVGAAVADLLRGRVAIEDPSMLQPDPRVLHAAV